MKKVFTTGDVARICRVTINTVVKWFDRGELKGYRIPGSGTRRVPRKDLLDFMKKYNFPMDGIVADKLRILAVDNDRAALSLFHRAFADKERYFLRTATSGFEAGLQTGELLPNIIFLNIDLGDIDARRICALLGENEETARVTVVAVSKKTKKSEIGNLEKLGFAEVLRKPFKSADLRQIVDRWAEK